MKEVFFTQSGLTQLSQVEDTNDVPVKTIMSTSTSTRTSITTNSIQTFMQQSEPYLMVALGIVGIYVLMS